jgi:anthranilate synthase component I
METDIIQNALSLNLGPDEYLTATSDQPKPLVIPLCAELPLPRCSPLDVFTATRKGSGFLLESIDGSEKIARYSYIGINPACMITLGSDVQVKGREPFVAIARDPEGTNPVDQIRSILARFHYVNMKAPRFFGGMVGYFSYDIVHALFSQVKRCGDTPVPPNPDARFMLAKDCIVFDHRDRKLFVFDSPFLTYDSDPAAEYERCVAHIAALAGQIDTLEQQQPLSGTMDGVREARIQNIRDNTGKAAFKRSVEQVKEHIVAGDIFQAVISLRMECPI